MLAEAEKLQLCGTFNQQRKPLQAADLLTALDVARRNGTNASKVVGDFRVLLVKYQTEMKSLTDKAGDAKLKVAFGVEYTTATELLKYIDSAGGAQKAAGVVTTDLWRSFGTKALVACVRG